jgi:hypothetical protein
LPSRIKLTKQNSPTTAINPFISALRSCIV